MSYRIKRGETYLQWIIIEFNKCPLEDQLLQSTTLLPSPINSYYYSNDFLRLCQAPCWLLRPLGEHYIKYHLMVYVNLLTLSNSSGHLRLLSLAWQAGEYTTPEPSSIIMVCSMQIDHTFISKNKAWWWFLTDFEKVILLNAFATFCSNFWKLGRDKQII